MSGPSSDPVDPDTSLRAALFSLGPWDLREKIEETNLLQIPRLDLVSSHSSRPPGSQRSSRPAIALRSAIPTSEPVQFYFQLQPPYECLLFIENTTNSPPVHRLTSQDSSVRRLCLLCAPATGHGRVGFVGLKNSSRTCKAIVLSMEVFHGHLRSKAERAIPSSA